MKSSKFSPRYRAERREKIMEKRGNAILQHNENGNRGQRDRWLKTGYSHPHSNDRQRARYARQLAAGRLNIAVQAPAKAKRPRKPANTT